MRFESILKGDSCMPKRPAKLAVFVLLIGVLLSAYAVYSIYAVPGLLQYAVLADTETPADVTDPDAPRQDSQLKRRMDSLSDMTETALEGAVTVHTLSGYAPQVTVTAEGGDAASGALTAVGERYFEIHPRYLQRGRLFYPEELEDGARVALMDEQFALKVFRMVDVVGREITVGGETYRVVGVLRHTRAAGEETEYGLYLPLAAVADVGGPQLQTLNFTARPVENGGAMTTFKSVATGWMPGGTLYDLRQEQVGATIWLRFLLCGLGFAVWGFLVGRFTDGVRAFTARTNARLRERYMAQIFPWFIWNILWRALAVAALALVAALLFNQMLSPVYFYPEYIPAVLVEPEDIAATFWKLQSQNGAQVLLRTVESIRVAFYAGLCRWGVMLTLSGLLIWAVKRRKPV